VGRSTDKQGSLSDHPSLWSDEELPRSVPRLPEKNFRSVRFPLWTQNKARLIQAYLRLFQFVTKHGAYVDGFAASQDPTHPETWAARLVLEIEPKWFRDFWLCDIDPAGIQRLESLRTQHASSKRRIDVLEGDFNEIVHKVLDSGRIREKTATFALLDQRTFECEWSTVSVLSKHKRQTKIEQFYFFPTGWIDRSLKAVRAPNTIAKVQRWWGRADWAQLLGMDGSLRAKMVARRFEEELGYGRAYPYPIHSERRGGRVMYHMIHATDHPEATPLMVRAYRQVSGRSDLEPEAIQANFDEIWRKVETDED